MDILNKLKKINKTNNSLVCIGLDSDFDKLPDHIKKMENPQFEFNKEIIDNTYNLVCAYKPNTAFYEARGAQGIKELQMTCNYIKDNYPDIFLILDAKRADIGNTNLGYIKFAFDYLNSDAITLHPYLGSQALQPFLDLNKGCIILCKTSNTGADEIQNIISGNEIVYQTIAKKVNTQWNKNNNCMLVVGATYPDELKKIRELCPELTFLIPGIGAQGGDLEAVLKNGLTKNKDGLIISSSRGIIFSSTNPNFAQKAKEETIKLRDQINYLIQALCQLVW